MWSAVGLLALVACAGWVALCLWRSQPTEQPAPGTRSAEVIDDSLPSNGLSGYRRRHALVVGINRYREAGGPFRDLKGPTYDAQEIAAVLAARYGFEDIVLVVDEEPRARPPGVAVDVVPAGESLTAPRLAGRLDALRARVGPGDALLFFYAGHGHRRGDEGYLVPAGGRPERAATLLGLDDVARRLRACDAHHTLMVLDCCFSGVALERGSGVEQAISAEGPLSSRLLGVRERDNLDRVLNRRAFQVITAGTGREPVGDVTELSQGYAERGRSLPEYQGHSPFTAVLLQALRGLTGLPDGRQLASDLGYYLGSTLVSDERTNNRQVPRYASLAGGDGDFIFFPAYRVLNPKLVAALYLDGPQYANLRQSACLALEAFIASQDEAIRSQLVTSAVPHLSRLLKDDAPATRRTAVEVLANAAEKYGDQVPEFGAVLSALADLMGDATQEEAIRHSAARAVGALRAYAEQDERVTDTFVAYVTELGTLWEQSKGKLAETLKIKVDQFVLPLELAAQLDEIGHPAELKANATARQRLSYFDVVRRRMMILLQPLSLRPYLERHERGKSFLTGAEKLLADQSLFAAKVMAAKSLGEDNRKDLNPGTLPPRLFPHTPEWARAKDLLLTPPHGELVWCSPLRSHHEGSVVSAVYSPGGEYLASSSADGMLRVWDARSGRLLWQQAATVPSLYFDPMYVHSIAFSPSGERVAQADAEYVKVYDVPSGTEVLRLTAGSARVNCVATDPRGSYWAGGCHDGTIYLWDGNNGKVQSRLAFQFVPSDKDPHNGEGGALYSQSVFALAFSPSGDTLAASGNNNWIRLWHPGTSKPPTTLTGHRFRIGGLAYSRDGRWLASASQDGTVRLWNTSSKEESVQFSTPTPKDRLSAPAYCNSVAFCPDGSEVAAACGDGSIRRWRIDTKVALEPLRAHTSGVRSIDYSPDGRTLVCAGSDTRYYPAERRLGERVLRFFDRASGQEQMQSESFLHHIMHLTFSPDGKRIATGGADKGVRFWNVATGALETNWKHDDSFPNSQADVKFAKSGTLLAYTDGYGSAWARDVQSGKVRWVIDRSKNGYRSFKRLSVSPDGELIAISDGNNIRCFGAESGELLRTLDMRASDALAFSPDGNRLACSSDSKILILDFETGKTLCTITRPLAHGRILTAPDGHAVLFSPDGLQVAFISEASIYVCNSSTSEVVRKLTGHSEFVNAIAYSPDGRFLASAGDDRDVIVWDMVSGELVVRHSGHTAAVYCLAFSPEGSLLASGGGDAILRLWNVMPGEKAKLLGHTHDVLNLAYSPDGLKLASESMDKTVCLWDMTTFKPTHKIPGNDITRPGFRYVSSAQWVAASTEGKNIKLWTEAGPPRQPLHSTRKLSAGVTISPNGELLAVQGDSSPQDAAIEVWDRVRSKQVLVVRGPKELGGGWQRATFSPDSKYLVAQSYEKHKIWSIPDGRLVAEFAQNLTITGAPTFSLDGRYVLYCDHRRKETVGIYGLETGELVRELSPGKPVNSILLSPDGRHVAVSLFNGGIELWEIETGNRVSVPYNSTRTGAIFGFSPDGKVLASTTSHISEKTISLFDVSKRAETGRFQQLFWPDGHQFSPDGQTFLTWGLANWGGFPQFWDVRTSGEYGRLRTSRTERLACSPDCVFVAINEKKTANLADRIIEYSISIRNWPPTVDWSRYQGVRSFHDLRLVWSAASDNLYGDTGDPYTVPPGSLLYHLRSDRSPPEVAFDLFVRFVQARNLVGAELLCGRMPDGPRKQEAEGILRNALRTDAEELLNRGALSLSRCRLTSALRMNKRDGEALYQLARLEGFLAAPRLSPSSRSDPPAVPESVVEHLTTSFDNGFTGFDRFLVDEAFSPWREAAAFRKLEDKFLPPDVDVDRLTRRGYAFARQGDFNRSLDDLGKCLRLRPKDPKVAYNLACFYGIRAASYPGTMAGKADRQRDVALALNVLEQALENGWADDRHMQADNDLAVVRLNSKEFGKLVERARKNLEKQRSE